MKQKYVVLEGLDFAGKSVMLKQLAEATGWETVNEPYTGNEHAAEIKRMNNANYLPKHYEMLMILASRVDCFKDVVSKHRRTGLISDRNVVSSMVYQSTDTTMPGMVLDINSSTIRGLTLESIYPSHLLFIDITHETFLERLTNCNRVVDEKDNFLKDPVNFAMMRERYLRSIEIFMTASKGITSCGVIKNPTVEDILDFIGYEKETSN